MKAVEFYHFDERGEETVKAVLAWDGGRWLASRGSEEFARKVIRQNILDPHDHEWLSSGEEPERFLDSLQFHYRSSYLGASPTKTGADVDLIPI